MSIFPTKILLATDGSEEAELALLTAVDLANRTDSELHVVHVGEPGPEITLNPAFAINRELWEETLREIEEAGGTVAEAHLKVGGRPDRQIVRLAEEINAGLVTKEQSKSDPSGICSRAPTARSGRRTPPLAGRSLVAARDHLAL